MAEHDHSEHELAWALNGSIVIETRDAHWTVDMTQALWIPRGVAHTVHRRSGALIFPVFLPPGSAGDPVGRVATVTRSSEIRQLVDVCLQQLLIGRALPAAATKELLDAIGRHAQPNGGLALPRDALARTVATELLRSPACSHTLTEWAGLLHTSAKTLQRRFQSETGSSFAQWRRRARLMAAQTLLAHGQNVTAVAGETGFSTPSAFIQAFRREYGLTPHRYRAATTLLS